MEAVTYLKKLSEEIHSTVVATLDENGAPVTCVIDMMDADENGLYFLTAKGKSFYTRLKRDERLSISGMKGQSTMDTVVVTVNGKAREIGSDKLSALFEKNPYMKDIYPSEASRAALTVFRVYEGTGELFDLSKLPPERAEFAFGGAVAREEGYIVTDRCTGCKRCYDSCPQKCIDITRRPVVIRQENCLRCGSCCEACPVHAVRKRI
ncbi:MAG: 4Fe-4S binding protein [Eubacteriales bacterium]|nr:4Fe-4S binding protein [Eubacteriales bacterium]